MEAFFQPEGRDVNFDPNKGTPGEYPAHKADETDAWRAAFDHACERGCTSKAAALFADAHEKDFTDGVPVDLEKLGQVTTEQLEAELEKRQGAKTTPRRRSPKS